MITLYTVITNGKDEQLDKNAKCFLDTYDRFKDPRRNSRIQKILAHKYIDTEYSIYIDGNIRLLVEPEVIIEKYLKDCDIAVSKHPVRDCLYDEALVCAKRELDDPEIIIKQVKEYEDNGYGKHKGLAECGIIIRRHTKKVEEFNNAWWSEFCVHSKRDQISFMYAVDKVGIPVNFIEDYFIEKSPTHAVKQSGEFEIVTHKKITTQHQ